LGYLGEADAMYERFYNLRERPFSLTPDPDYLYPSRVHTEALSYLRYGIEGHAGFVVITGEIGSGKTTLLQTALRSLDRQTSIARRCWTRASCSRR
jgi:type II secretory pathway predicted ATPase ExeA